MPHNITVIISMWCIIGNTFHSLLFSSFFTENLHLFYNLKKLVSIKRNEYTQTTLFADLKTLLNSNL